jgi:hypothetical protein
VVKIFFFFTGIKFVGGACKFNTCNEEFPTAATTFEIILFNNLELRAFIKVAGG